MAVDLSTKTTNQEGTYWPINREELVGIGDEFLKLIVRYSALEKTGISTEACCFSTLMPKLLVELVSLTQAEMLIQRARRDGVQILIPSGAELWLALDENRPIAEGQFTRSLQAGVKKRAWWKNIIRPARNLIAPQELKYTNQANPFSYTYLNLVDFTVACVCVSLSPLAVRHATIQNERVYFFELQEWFYPPGSDQLPIEAENNTLSSNFLDEVNAILLDHRISLSVHGWQYLKNWLAKSSAWVRYYNSRLVKLRKYLPKTLWITTSGIIWTRMLADAVISNGGNVVAHDHGWGCNYSTHNPWCAIETFDITEFVTFSNAHVESTITNRSRYLPSHDLPRIKSLSLKWRKNLGARRTVKKDGILYVLTLYPLAEKCTPRPMLPTPIAVDFQLRVIEKLIAWGNKVFVKPHPSCKQVTPPIFEERFGVKEINDRFEDVVEQAELLIFDFPLTTTWGYAIQTEIPILYLDFNMAPQTPFETEMLDRRCARVECTFDHYNRAETDWDLVKSGIEKAKSLKDNAYVTHLLGAGM